MKRIFKKTNIKVITPSLLGILLVAGIFYFHGPTIQWTPEKIEQDIFKGTTKVVNAQFVSNKDLENVQLWITPELEQFLTITPNSFDTINKNETKQIEIITSIPLNVSPNIYEGTIHLKSTEKSKRTYSQTLKIVLDIKEPTAEEIPLDEVSFPTVERIYEDEETGAVYVEDEVVIRFQENTSETRVKEIISTINGRFLGYISDIEIYQVLVPVTDPSELKSIIQQLESYPEVIIATYHWMDRIDSK